MRAILSLFAVLLFATPALAQDLGDDVEAKIAEGQAIYESECVQQGVQDGSVIAKANKSARAACAQLRGCKKQCRGAKKTAKKAVRSNKKNCKKACKGKKGKAKRQCKKACRKAAKPARKNVRHAKRGCIKSCRAKFKTPACKAARGAVLKSFAAAVGNLFKNRKDCEDQMNAAVNMVKKADQAEDAAQD